MKKFPLRAADLDELRIDVMFLNTSDPIRKAECRTNAFLIYGALDLLNAAYEASEFIEGQEDVVDGPDSVPQPNDAMKLGRLLRDAIAKATGWST